MSLFGGECLNCGKALEKCKSKYCCYKCGYEYRKLLAIANSDDCDELFNLAPKR